MQTWSVKWYAQIETTWKPIFVNNTQSPSTISSHSRVKKWKGGREIK